MASRPIDPRDFPRRSFVADKLIAAGAVFEEVDGAAVAAGFSADAEVERQAALRCGLADLSPLPRTGFKGRGTAEWLTGRGVAVPEASNRASRQDAGALAVRLAPSEVLLLGGLGAAGELCARLERAWAEAGVPPEQPRGFPALRSDSHAWLMLSGREAPAMFAKLCAVDLRPHAFADLSVAQTSVARLAGVVVRDDLGEDGVLAYHLLVDSAAAGYMWDCLVDAMAEFDGKPVGLRTLQALTAR